MLLEEQCEAILRFIKKRECVTKRELDGYMSSLKIPRLDKEVLIESLIKYNGIETTRIWGKLCYRLKRDLK